MSTLRVLDDGPSLPSPGPGTGLPIVGPDGRDPAAVPHRRLPSWLKRPLPASGGLGPMAGQNHHFAHYAAERLPYAIDRYVDETNRLYGVLDQRLADRPFVAGADYSIADMACYPWVVPHERQGQNLADFPNLERWFRAIEARPATIRAYETGDRYRNREATMDEEAKRAMFPGNYLAQAAS